MNIIKQTLWFQAMFIGKKAINFIKKTSQDLIVIDETNEL